MYSQNPLFNTLLFMSKKISSGIKVTLLTILLPVMSFNTFAFEQAITLTPVKQNQTETLVTMGIPFAPGVLKSEKNIRLFDDTGQEISIFSKPTLQWHFKTGEEKTIRAVMIQFTAALNQGVKEYSFTYDTPRTESKSIASRRIDIGLHVSSNIKKSNARTPNMIAVLDTEWLVESQIIPPFVGMQNDEQKTYWDAQFAWAKDLDYTKKNIGNWLFDRVTSLYKGCMRTENAACYQEAFQSYDYWMKSIQREGGLSNCLGGSLIGGEQKACDTKYTYLEHVKLHLALTGDDTLHDNELLDAMARLSREQFYYQGRVDSDYNSQRKFFTERAAGLKLLAQVAAYELTGSQEALDSINQRVSVLEGHQLSNPDGFPADGSWRHSWSRHEGDSYPGDYNKDDRRYSVWMTENIIDGLWQAYQVTNDDRIPDMLVRAASAINKWGFSDSVGYTEKFGNTLHKLPKGSVWFHTCNTTGLTTLYSGSSTAGYEALINTQNNEGWYSDSHNPEMVLPLALGVYFSSDVSIKDSLLARIEQIKLGYLNASCGKGSSTPRKFNWNNRSNAWATYLWVVHKTDNPASSDDNDVEIPSEDNTNTSIILDDFEQNRLAWKDESRWEVKEGQLYFKSHGLYALNEDIGGNFEISMDIKNTSSSTMAAGIMINAEDKGFYTVRVKNGPWGGAYIYYHKASWDYSGKIIANESFPVDQVEYTNLKVKVEPNHLTVFVDNNSVLELDLTHKASSEGHGLFSLAGPPDLTIDNVEIKIQKSVVVDDGKITFDYSSLAEDWSCTGNWYQNESTLHAGSPGIIISKNVPVNISNYSLNTTLSSPELINAKMGVIFGKDEEAFYSLKIRHGQWGGIYIYRHIADWDISGHDIAFFHKSINSSNVDIKIVVSDKVEIYMDGVKEFTEGSLSSLTADVGFTAIISSYSYYSHILMEY